MQNNKQTKASNPPLIENEAQISRSNGEKQELAFKKGDPITMIRVRFPGNAKSFPFLTNKRSFTYGQKVLAMSDRGMAVGYINSFPYEALFQTSMMPIRSISRLANEEDFKAQEEHNSKEIKAEILCKDLIKKHKLDMTLTHVEFIQFGKKAVFYFIAPARVDFRGLVKDLVYQLKMRIELRQISVRDRTAALGAVGACGLQTCCSSFLKTYGDVSIKMAKNQNLALIPSKINGVCGQLKCCIKYEDQVYQEKKRKLPKEGTFIRVKNNDLGKVLKVFLLTEQFEMLTDTGKKRRYLSNQLLEDSRPPADWKFPDQFKHINDETKQIIGMVGPLIRPQVDSSEIGQIEIEATPEELPSRPQKNNRHQRQKSTQQFKWDDKADNKSSLASDPTFKSKTNNDTENTSIGESSPGLLGDSGSKKSSKKANNRNRNRNTNKNRNRNQKTGGEGKSE